MRCCNSCRDRGFDYAEVTAGGVPLSEIDVSTMASRLRPNLFLCGEILDVDGRIGGYNFQWRGPADVWRASMQLRRNGQQRDELKRRRL